MREKLGHQRGTSGMENGDREGHKPGLKRRKLDHESEQHERGQLDTTGTNTSHYTHPDNTWAGKKSQVREEGRREGRENLRHQHRL